LCENNNNTTKIKKENKHRNEITLILSSEFLCGESETVLL